jgi:hypothetical protein
MVNTVNVSSYDGSPPESLTSEGRHYIDKDPLYTLQALESALEAGEGSLELWTRECVKDVRDRLDLDMSDLLTLFRVISAGNATYLKSEWCIQKINGPWAACDSYSIKREEWIKHANKYMNIEYYIKFAINKSGKLLLIVSCHISK